MKIILYIHGILQWLDNHSPVVYGSSVLAFQAWVTKFQELGWSVFTAVVISVAVYVAKRGLERVEKWWAKRKTKK